MPFYGGGGGGSGEGTPGPKGAKGDSAYAVALSEGFVGTQAQWLTSLVGDGADIPVTFAVMPGYENVTMVIGGLPVPDASEFTSPTVYMALPELD